MNDRKKGYWPINIIEMALLFLALQVFITKSADDGVGAFIEGFEKTLSGGFQLELMKTIVVMIFGFSLALGIRKIIRGKMNKRLAYEWISTVAISAGSFFLMNYESSETLYGFYTAVLLFFLISVLQILKIIFFTEIMAKD